MASLAIAVACQLLYIDVTMTKHTKPSTSAHTPVMLCIMDGWGIAPESPYNAVTMAQTPHFDRIWAEYPHSQLDASESAVGLPEGQPGNSEVGHMTIGSGRIIKQDLPRIHDAIRAGELERHSELLGFANRLKQTGRTAHLTGLTSVGGVHAHSEHIIAIARILTDLQVPVALHLITDGRDRMPKDAQDELPEFLNRLPEQVMIASLSGRYFAMDRDRRWERTQSFVAVVESGTASYRADSALAALTNAYGRGETDEFVSPTVIADYQGMVEGDGIIMANFRVDRARQFMRAFYAPEETELYQSGFSLSNLALSPRYNGPALSMTPLSDDLAHIPALFGPADLSGGLGEIVSGAGLRQLRLAETEKYPHVTFFFNGGVEIAFGGEERKMAASPKVATYDQAPEMSAEQVLSDALQAIESHSHDLIILNFANPDMVGHTGDISAAIHAVETVDAAIGRLEKAMIAAGGELIITADHGNCEVMWDEDAQSAHTAHTTNQVPCIWVSAHKQQADRIADGGLADLAPTLLALLSLEPSAAMSGKSLLRNR